MKMSKFNIHSIGIVATNKALDSHEVEVTPIETLPFLEGELNQSPTTQEAQGIDGSGNAYTVKVTTDNTVTATWYPETNRRTPPDVRRGERVVLWKYADADKFYWTSMGRDDNLRKLETVIFTFSDTQDESLDSTDPENCYSLEVSTHTGQVTFQTVKANGEPYAYTFQFNTKEGCVVLADDVGNYAEMDSAATLIKLMNRLGTTMELNKKDINAFAPKDINAEATQNVSVTAGKNISVRAGQNISAQAEAGNVDVKAAQNAVVDGGASAMLKSGGSFLKFTPAGGEIKAPVMKGGS